MAIRTFLLITGILIFISCNLAKKNSSIMELSDKSYFSVQSETHFDYKYTRSDGSIAYTNYEAPKFYLDKNDIRVEVYSVVKDCSPLLVGTTKLQKNIYGLTGQTVFGIVGNKEQPFDSHSYPDALCKPPLTSTSQEEYWSGHGFDGAGAYVLCSEKDGKTVVICISQMTDNPQLAEEIFSTFRWTE